jgi:hypothetical protein
MDLWACDLLAATLQHLSLACALQSLGAPAAVIPRAAALVPQQQIEAPELDELDQLLHVAMFDDLDFPLRQFAASMDAENNTGAQAPVQPGATMPAQMHGFGSITHPGKSSHVTDWWHKCVLPKSAHTHPFFQCFTHLPPTRCPVLHCCRPARGSGTPPRTSSRQVIERRNPNLGPRPTPAPTPSSPP